MAKLTAKQKRFIEEYLFDLNATQAAIRAGYSVDSAYSIGNENLKKPEIKSSIDKAIAERSRRTGINTDRVLRELGKIAFINPADVINLDTATVKEEATREGTACIQSIKIKTIPTEDGDITEREIKTYDKLKALELCGKHLGMWTERIDLNATMGVQIVDDIYE